ncbi:hypothetical protein RVS70_13125 [Virgibacillus sp. M23]|nr:hypothetical protein [Virgibacillus sp. M23]MDY7045143.1 hypothetical protein [Virgibacillus sp. M23]
MVVPQEYDQKVFEPIGHLLAVAPLITHSGFTLLLAVGGLLPVICG